MNLHILGRGNFSCFSETGNFHVGLLTSGNFSCFFGELAEEILYLCTVEIARSSLGGILSNIEDSYIKNIINIESIKVLTLYNKYNVSINPFVEKPPNILLMYVCGLVKLKLLKQYSAYTSGDGMKKKLGSFNVWRTSGRMLNIAKPIMNSLSEDIKYAYSIIVGKAPGKTEAKSVFSRAVPETPWTYTRNLQKFKWEDSRYDHWT